MAGGRKNLNYVFVWLKDKNALSECGVEVSVPFDLNKSEV